MNFTVSAGVCLKFRFFKMMKFIFKITLTIPRCCSLLNFDLIELKSSMSSGIIQLDAKKTLIGNHLTDSMTRDVLTGHEKLMKSTQNSLPKIKILEKIYKIEM